MKGTQVHHLITRFRVSDEGYDGEIEATHIPLSTLIDIFHAPSGDPLMICSYKVGADQATALREFLEQPLDLSRFDYYIEGIADISNQ